jgi:hypothetical protein
MPPTGSVGAEVLQSALIVNGAVPEEIITPSAGKNVLIDIGVRHPEKKPPAGKQKVTRSNKRN